MGQKKMILRNDFRTPTPSPKSFPKVGVILQVSKLENNHHITSGIDKSIDGQDCVHI